MPATIEQYPLEKAKKVKRWLEAIIRWIILVILLAVFQAFVLPALSLPVWSFAILLAALAVWQWVYETKYFDAYYYDVGKDFLAIRKGWITPREIQMPYEKMQDVYLDQDILDRVFGLWDVHVSTATVMSGMEAHMDGVNRPNAEKIREHLLQKIQSKRGKVTGYD